jgi:hypothetical protein
MKLGLIFAGNTRATPDTVRGVLRSPVDLYEGAKQPNITPTIPCPTARHLRAELVSFKPKCWVKKLMNAGSISNGGN